MFAEEPVAADLDRWTALAGGAAAGASGGILPAFERGTAAAALVLKGFFLARTAVGGRCDDLLRLVHDFHEDIFTQYLQVHLAQVVRPRRTVATPPRRLAGHARGDRAGPGARSSSPCWMRALWWPHTPKAATNCRFSTKPPWTRCATGN